MARLLISAAHTMENPGAVYQDLREADLTRKLLMLCLPYLDAKKIEYKAVPLDLPLPQRIEWINNTGYTEAQGDLFFEIHINDGGKRGIEGWYKGNSSPTNRSEKFTKSVVDNICKVTGYQNQGAKSEYEHELTSLLILNSTNPTATCIELLYLDNAEDIAIIKDQQKMNDLAKVIVDSIELFITEDAKTPRPAPINATTTGLNIEPATLPPSNTYGGGGFRPSNPILTGSSGFNSNSNSFMPSSPSANPPMGQTNGGSSGMVMDREQRKEMIKRVYLKILGKEISQNDLNYYLNLGVSEVELIQKLIDHKDFQAMVKDGAEAKELRLQAQKLEGEVALLNSTISDTKALQTSLNNLLEQKNIMIQRLYQELQANKIVIEGQHIDSIKSKALSDAGTQNTVKSKTPLKRKLLHRLMKIAKV